MKSARNLLPLMFICCLLWSSIEATPQYHLSCPPLDDDIVGTCSEECPMDDGCPNGQLCCSNGCGHSCVEATRTPYYTPPTSSMCPPVNDDIAGTCDERCANNSDCSTGEVCCSNGCGHVCMAPLSTCEAVLLTASNQSLIGSYQPQCNEDGTFSRVQCHASTGYCWCVDPKSGHPVSDQVRFKQPQCNCTYDGVTHYAGESFAAGDGCNECHCTVDGGVKCTELDVPCPDQELFYSCPAVRADMAGSCVHDCSLDSDCPHSGKCCYNGCGHTCQSPVLIPYVRLSETMSCPSTNEVPCVDQEGGGSCHDPAFGCDEGQVCCDNDCASAVCLSLSDLKPCVTAKKLSVSNSSEPLLGAYQPRCDQDGLFRDIQCHEHYCWCVETSTGRPTSDMVPFENRDDLQCSGCVYNGRKYHLHDSFASTDGCNQCTCFEGGVACTEMGCFPIPTDEGRQGGRTGDDDHLWEWWHTILIVCVAVVIILGIIVAILIVGVFVLMRQNGQYRHQKLKEVIPEKYEVSREDTPYQPYTPEEEVQFKTGQDSIELKVPVEDNDDHKPAHA